MKAKQEQHKERRFKCRQAGCPNTFTDVIGGDNAFGKNAVRASDCIPCNFAAQMIENDQTPEMIEAVPQLMETMLPLLNETGWTWEHVKDSFTRRPVIW